LSVDCFATEQALLPTATALEQLRQTAEPLVATETVGLNEAHGRVLAEAVISPRDIPGFDNAAVDGYAVRGADLNPDEPTTLPISAFIAAGHAAPEPLAPGTAAYILTGARLPSGADTVVMQEEVSVTEVGAEKQVTLPAKIKAGSNWRPQGEDVALGQQVFASGQRLRPQDIGMLSALGQAQVTVYQPLRVAVFSTGDEIVEPGQPLPADGVYDVNRYMLKGLLANAGCTVTDLGVLPDRADVVKEALAEAAQNHQLVITSGGASTGSEDHVAQAVTELGALHFWRIAVKPGRPMAFGQIGDTRFVGLPGNPVATAACFLRFVFPLLNALAGQGWVEPQLWTVPADFTLKKKPNRRELLRGQLVRDEQGELRAAKHAKQGSGILSSLVEGDGLIEVMDDVTLIEPGDPVQFMPFSQFNIS